ncbi:anti-sigma factor [Gordonia soli]|uniref:Regulator of SigK n=1 Tax=Gordonia soli NBRC 108243 TaxID=1223545 RepID=M0QCD4_9ACTN|nr:anti-sigma factor [Gordonia soli]GAC66278.1 anti-sigma-K factor RskA [Gordonia soli NBRC 108243]
MPDTRWLDDHIELYAVDVLPNDERARVETELGALAAVERGIYDARVAEIQGVIADYASAYALLPADELRARVLDYVFAADATRPGPVAPPAAPSGRHAADPGIAGPDVAGPPPPTSLAEHRERRSRRWPLIAASAAAIAVVALGAGVLVGRVTAPEPSTTTNQADQQRSQVLDVLSAPDASLSAGRLGDQRGAVSVVTSKVRNQAVAVLRDVRNPVPSDRQLQLWKVGGDPNPVSAGLFEPGETPPPLLVDALDGSSVLAVTVEPRGGSAQPTTRLLTQIPV